ncbi:hypothetical protein [Pseudoduganella sp.]|uniref:hypothetical protein n=1 Tax=Pseudoduganella sp. TaxID=1880898 RepID=UPI0035B3749A
MRKIVLSAIALLALSTAHAAGAEVRNLAPAFTAAYDASAQLPMPERVAAMKKVLLAQYPEFYGSKAPEKLDESIAYAIETFPRLREAYTDKADKFGGALQQNLSTYTRTFPDFRLNVPTSVIHSLYEMDGGTRELNGKLHLIFGADMLAHVNPKGNAAPLFHHELFHVMHAERFSCGEGKVWPQLWLEGLATYVSHALNPGASETDLVLNFPAGMPAGTREKLPQAWRQLSSVLDSSDSAVYGELFTMSSGQSTELPRRRGYYLGYLIAKDAARTRDLATLASMDCQQVRGLIESTISKLSKEAM